MCLDETGMIYTVFGGILVNGELNVSLERRYASVFYFYFLYYSLMRIGKHGIVTLRLFIYLKRVGYMRVVYINCNICLIRNKE